MKTKHQNDQGKPAFDRGKAPHKGGAYKANIVKGINPFKVWFEVSNGNESNFGIRYKGIAVESSWTPGKQRGK